MVTLKAATIQKAADTSNRLDDDMTCSNCNTEMKMLFSSFYCPNDCDKKETDSSKKKYTWFYMSEDSMHYKDICGRAFIPNNSVGSYIFINSGMGFSNRQIIWRMRIGNEDENISVKNPDTDSFRVKCGAPIAQVEYLGFYEDILKEIFKE